MSTGSLPLSRQRKRGTGVSHTSAKAGGDENAGLLAPGSGSPGCGLCGRLCDCVLTVQVFKEVDTKRPLSLSEVIVWLPCSSAPFEVQRSDGHPGIARRTGQRSGNELRLPSPHGLLASLSSQEVWYLCWLPQWGRGLNSSQPETGWLGKVETKGRCDRLEGPPSLWNELAKSLNLLEWGGGTRSAPEALPALGRAGDPTPQALPGTGKTLGRLGAAGLCRALSLTAPVSLSPAWVSRGDRERSDTHSPHPVSGSRVLTQPGPLLSSLVLVFLLIV